MADLSALADSVIAATGPKANARLAAMLPSLVRHLHQFAIETALTAHEWNVALDFINECGRISDTSRNETQLLGDVLGLESLVDLIADQLANDRPARTASAADTAAITASTASLYPPTPSAILGPFYRPEAPIVPLDGYLVRDLTGVAPAGVVRIAGAVREAGSGRPLPGNAIVDIWHCAPNGLYEQQDPGQPDMNLRGRIAIARDSGGRFAAYSLQCAPYPIPDDGPVGLLLRNLDRQFLRPAHIHFIVSAPGYRTLVTQLFDARGDNNLSDAVFAFKDALVVHTRPLHNDPRASWSLEYDFFLVPEPADV